MRVFYRHFKLAKVLGVSVEELFQLEEGGK